MRSGRMSGETILRIENLHVSIEDTVKSFDEILSGELDDLPEQAFYLVGDIEEAKEKGKKMD